MVIQVMYEAGSNGVALPPVYMNSLDCELVPVLHSGAIQGHLTLELVFHILDHQVAGSIGELGTFSDSLKFSTFAELDHILHTYSTASKYFSNYVGSLLQSRSSRGMNYKIQTQTHPSVMKYTITLVAEIKVIATIFCLYLL